jgi:hypothetical protein
MKPPTIAQSRPLALMWRASTSGSPAGLENSQQQKAKRKTGKALQPAR